jgi:hypothetical protein
MGSEPISPDTIRTLGRVAGVDIPEEDLALLVGALTTHLASVNALPTMDVTDVEPPLIFRATWDE